MSREAVLNYLEEVYKKDPKRWVTSKDIYKKLKLSSSNYRVLMNLRRTGEILYRIKIKSSHDYTGYEYRWK